MGGGSVAQPFAQRRQAVSDLLLALQQVDSLQAFAHIVLRELARTPIRLDGVDKRLVDELPEGTPPAQVQMHLMMQAAKDDAARGVVWPEVAPLCQSSARERLQ